MSSVLRLPPLYTLGVTTVAEFSPFLDRYTMGAKERDSWSQDTPKPLKPNSNPVESCTCCLLILFSSYCSRCFNHICCLQRRSTASHGSLSASLCTLHFHSSVASALFTKDLTLALGVLLNGPKS